MNTLKFIDTHAHLDFEGLYENLDEIVDSARNCGVEKIIIPGVIIQDIPKIIKIIDKYENIYGAVALHPSEAKNWKDEYYYEMKNYATHVKIIAIGETGLDYFWDKTFIENQKYVFRKHLQLAAETNLPVIIHNREAHLDTLEIIKEFPEVKGVMHCFSGSAEFALECIKAGYYVALGGPVTFKNAKKPKEVAQKIPLNKLLLETDSPYLAPQAFRGKKNDPSKIPLIAEEISSIKGISIEKIAEATTFNVQELFKI